MTKYFIITVDTEEEGGWCWKPGDIISTENSLFIPRFQKLCEEYKYPPVYLTNWEMANEPRFIDRAIDWEKNGNCEIGIHLHAWSNPPYIPLERKFSSADYLIEYDTSPMYHKFSKLHELLTNKIGHKPYSHRAGRWAMDNRYFKLLNDFGIQVDCSVTPGINWSNNMGANSGGSDYSMYDLREYFINGILEVPMTIKYMHTWGYGSYKHKIKCLIKGKNVWLRPAGQSSYELISLVNRIYQNPTIDYLEFMIHSNELMPGGSPYFKSENDVKNLFIKIEKLFNHVKSLGYTGMTLKSYYDYKKKTQLS